MIIVLPIVLTIISGWIQFSIRSHRQRISSLWEASRKKKSPTDIFEAGLKGKTLPETREEAEIKQLEKSFSLDYITRLDSLSYAFIIFASLITLVLVLK